MSHAELHQAVVAAEAAYRAASDDAARCPSEANEARAAAAWGELAAAHRARAEAVRDAVTLPEALALAGRAAGPGGIFERPLTAGALVVLAAEVRRLQAELAEALAVPMTCGEGVV